MTGQLTVNELVGVVGGGRMGCGIAHAFLVAGRDVTVVEAATDRHGQVRAQLERDLLATAGRRGVSVSDLGAGRVSVAGDVRGLGEAGLVVEAVPEDLDLKVAVFRALEGSVPGTAVLASNTSSLPIARLAEAVSDPSRVIGLHFFNPVPASALVEVVVAAATSEVTLGAARAWVEAIGKTAVVVQDSPGFASSRLGVTLGLEAIRMVEAGVASAADIDAAMTLGYKHPVGPLRLTDLVGLDVRLDIARHLERELGPRFAPPPLLLDMVGRGQLGRKSGRGFYEWED